MSGTDPASAPDAGVVPACVVVDVANVVGSRPDGWWRDRAGAATRLLGGLAGLRGREASVDAERVRIVRIVAVLEGAAKAATAPEGVIVVRAPHDGDSTIVSTAHGHLDSGERVVVVTADRGLRARLAGGVLVTGPGWLNDLLGR